jgi:uncharacterized membrane protein YkoI
MKKYFFFLLLLCLTTIGFSQEMKISYKALPTSILQAFRAAYPNARFKNGTKEITKGDTYYEINCNDGGVNRTITLDKDGKITEAEEELTVDKLPDAVANAITKQYTKGKILHIESSVKDSKTVYEVFIRDKKKKVEVVFSPDGNVVGGK